MARRILKSLLIGCFGGVLLAGCVFQEDDVTFARKAMEQLIEGRYAARPRLDWPRLIILGREVGRQYSQYATEQERIDYARSFIRSFSESYKKAGAKASAFFDWRIYDNHKGGPDVKVVTAYCHDKTTSFFFFIAGEKKARKIFEIVATRPVGPAKVAPAREGAVGNGAP